MSKTSLSYIKKVLRIDFDSEDDTLQQMAEAAEQRICRDTQRTMKELCERSINGRDLPYDLQQATAALVGAWYNSPEAFTTMSTSSINENYIAIISPYMRLI